MKIQSLLLVCISFFSATLADTPFEYCGVMVEFPRIRLVNVTNLKASPILPLRSVSVRADVRALAVAVNAELTYENKFDEAIECQFVFPMIDTAAVYKLEATMGATKLRAEVRNRTEAETIYRQAVNAGRKSTLLESQRGSPDVYRIMLGNLQPGERAVVTIGYAQPVNRDSDTGALSFTLPVVLNPRYIPEDTSIRDLQSNFQAGVPYVSVSEVSYTMNFSVNVDLGISSQIEDIKTGNKNDTLSVEISQNKRTASARMTSEFKQDHDFSLTISVVKAMKPTVFVENGVVLASSDNPNDNTAAWLSLDIAAAWFEPYGSVSSKYAGSSEYWLIIDRSGSMEGEKIASARTALGIFIKSLPMGCTFNIIGFGDNYEPLFGQSVNYTEITAKQALTYAASLEADYGGTEILPALIYAYQQSNLTSPNKKRFVLLLTDGEVSNTEQVIAAAQENAEIARVFSIGIGDGASTALVNGVARVSNGLSEFVGNNKEGLQAKVVAMLKATTLPIAENVAANWKTMTGKGNIVVTMPQSVPKTSYKGRSVQQYAAFQRQDSVLDGSFTFSATIDDNKLDLTFPFKFSSSDVQQPSDPMPLHRLAAKARLTELTDEYRKSKSAATKDEAIMLSIVTGVVCEFTAFVAVDTESKQSQDTNSTNGPLFVNIARPTRYAGGEEDDGEISPPAFSAARPGGASFASYSNRGRSGPAVDYDDDYVDDVLGEPIAANLPGPPPPPTNPYPPPGGAPRAPGAPVSLLISSRFGMLPATTTTTTWPLQATSNIIRPQKLPLFPSVVGDEDEEEDEAAQKELVDKEPSLTNNLESLIGLQEFSGAWSMNKQLPTVVASPNNLTNIVALNSTVRQVIDSAGTIVHSEDISDDTVATLISITVLRHRFGSRRDEWDLVGGKAIDYLSRSQLPTEDSVLDVLIKAIGVAIGI